jgi:rare lipoprotein A
MIFLVFGKLSAQDTIKTCTDKGKASFYAKMFEGRKTANGEIYKGELLTAAHRTFAFGTLVKVTNLTNYKSVIVRINDRGPYAKHRIIDLSKAAAKEIGLVHQGVGNVLLECIFIPPVESELKSDSLVE